MKCTQKFKTSISLNLTPSCFATISLSVYAFETFSEIDDMLDDKTSLSKLKRIEIINIIVSAYSGMKLPTEKNLNSQIKGN